jgi:hypothetical protein
MCDGLTLFRESLLLPRRLDGSGRDRQSSLVGKGGMWNDEVKGRTRNKYLRCFVRISRSSFIKRYYNFMLIQDEIQCSPIATMGTLQWPIYFGA